MKLPCLGDFESVFMLKKKSFTHSSAWIESTGAT